MNYIDPIARMEQHPGSLRSRATPIIAKGYVYPLTEKHGSISKKLALRIDFERARQEKSRLQSAFFNQIRPYGWDKSH